MSKNTKRIVGTIMQVTALTVGVVAAFQIHFGLGLGAAAYLLWLFGEEVVKS